MCLESSSLCLFNIFINHLGHACLSNLWIALVWQRQKILWLTGSVKKNNGPKSAHEIENRKPWILVKLSTGQTREEGDRAR